MSFRFPEQSRLGDALRAARYLVAGRRQWHNRCFASGQSIEADDLGFTIRWAGRGELRARRLEALRRDGRRAAIVASGPSVRGLRRPERLFDLPVCCVNGSVELAAELGRQADYYFVSDYRFILDRPDLFAVGVRVSRAVVLNPMAVFAALLAAPDAVAAANLFLREDLRRPFRRPRPTRRELAGDPRVIVAAGGEMAFSLDPGRGTFPAGTVVYDALQVLFGIGYRDVSMFGVDLTGGPRFYHEACPATDELARAYDERIEPAFELVAEYLRRSGCMLVNGSPASRLPANIIPKVDGNLLLDRLGRHDSALSAVA
jgi:hypothetical protein